MDEVFTEWLSQPLASFRLFQYELDAFVNRVDVGSIRHYSIASRELLELLRKLLMAAPSLAFQDSFVEEYDRWIAKKGPIR